jgi:hypothetical protein
MCNLLWFVREMRGDLYRVSLGWLWPSGKVRIVGPTCHCVQLAKFYWLASDQAFVRKFDTPYSLFLARLEDKSDQQIVKTQSQPPYSHPLKFSFGDPCFLSPEKHYATKAMGGLPSPFFSFFSRSSAFSSFSSLLPPFLRPLS